MTSAAFEQRDRRLGVLPGERRHRDGRATWRLRSRRLGWRRWNRDRDFNRRIALDHRSGIRPLANDGSGTGGRLRAGGPAQPQPRALDLRRNVFVPGIQQVRHASPARRRRHGDPEIDRRIAVDDRSAIRLLPQDRSLTLRRLGANGAPDTQPRSCNLLRRLGEHIVDQIRHASRAGLRSLNGDCDAHARVAGDDRFCLGRLRDNTSSRISSRFDAGHAAEDEAPPCQRGACFALLVDCGDSAWRPLSTSRIRRIGRAPWIRLNVISTRPLSTSGVCRVGRAPRIRLNVVPARRLRPARIR
jgi:hypothetical protein